MSLKENAGANSQCNAVHATEHRAFVLTEHAILFAAHVEAVLTEPS